MESHHNWLALREVSTDVNSQTFHNTNQDRMVDPLYIELDPLQVDSTVNVPEAIADAMQEADNEVPDPVEDEYVNYHEDEEYERQEQPHHFAVSYTHLTLPTKRIV